MCRVLEVHRSAYYHWLMAETPMQTKMDNKITEMMIELFAESRETYGSRSLRSCLYKLGYQVSRRRIGRLMKQAGLICKTKKKFKVTTDSKHNLPISPNLLTRQFTVNAPNRVYVGDITYIWTQEGWMYLATVIDLFSRKVVG